MASILLRSAGAAAGNALLPGIGGALLGTLGRSIGGVIDGQLGLGTQVTGPRLENLSVQDSRYGAAIPTVYGRARVAGNVIWSSDLIEAQHDSSFSGGKGALSGSSTTTTTYTYSVHCAIGIALGPIAGLTTIWADSTVIYQNGIWTTGLVDSASIYTGSSTQPADPFMQSMLGSANVPAYRGLAYIVLENLQLGNFGNRLPNLTFEILPVTSSATPNLISTIDAMIGQKTATIANNGMVPIILDGNATEVRQVLLGGFKAVGGAFAFEAVAFDISGDTPLELTRVASASFGGGSMSDCSCALAPDGRFVAFCFQYSGNATHYLALYDIASQQFGAIATATLAVTTATRAIGWIDATHFVVDDVVGTARGLHAFARAGSGIIDLGFTNIWGAGTATNYQPLNYASFTPYAGGLLHYVWDVSAGDLTIYVRPLAWRGNGLSVGAAYTLVAHLTLSGGSGPGLTVTRIGANEWVLCYSTVVDYQMLSFEPGLASAVITRPWQHFTLTAGTGTQNIPIFFNDRLVMLQSIATLSTYSLSEVMLDSGSFNLVNANLPVSGFTAYSNSFTGIRIDVGRILVLAGGGFTSDVSQLGVLQRAPTGTTLDAITADILNRSGYASADYTVSALAGIAVDGYLIQDVMTARSAIEPLQVFQPFDLVESAGQLVAVPRHATPDAVIDAGEWRGAPDKSAPPPALESIRAQELDLPLEMNIDYIDASREFEINSQRARRIVTKAQAVQKLSLPLVCTAALAKQIAETRLYTLWNERILVRLSVSRRWLALDPGDVVDLGNGDLLRVTSVNQAGGLMVIEGFYVYADALASAADADVGQTTTLSNLASVDSMLYLLDLPLLQASDDQPGVYAAATGLAGWKSATVWRSPDGVNYNQIASLTSAATAGLATTALGNQSGCYVDNASSVTVQLIAGSLSSCADTELYNGANAAVLGGEIIQFGSATLIGPGLYTLSHLLRGRRGTEAATGTHQIGDSFVLLTAGSVDFMPALLTDRNAAYDFRALTNRQSLGDAQDTAFTYSLGTIQPFAPVNIQGSRASGAGSDLTLVWKRRARLHGDWVDYIDVPLDEPSELYDVDVMNGATAVRTFGSLTAPTVTYAAAQQAADWPGGIPASFTVNIYQLSSRYGRGNAGTAVV